MHKTSAGEEVEEEKKPFTSRILVSSIIILLPSRSHPDSLPASQRADDITAEQTMQPRSSLHVQQLRQWQWCM